MAAEAGLLADAVDEADQPMDADTALGPFLPLSPGSLRLEYPFIPFFPQCPRSRHTFVTHYYGGVETYFTT